MALGLGFTSVEPTIGLLPLQTYGEVVANQMVGLNDIAGATTFVRATSAYDPGAYAIAAPGVRRRNTAMVGRSRAFGGDLIEGAGVNLIGAGKSEHFALWTPVNAPTVVDQAALAPDGTMTASTLQDSSAALFEDVTAIATVANDSSVYCFSLYILKTTGGTSAVFGITLTLSGGTGVSVQIRVNTDTGAIGNGGGPSAGNPTATSVGAWWRVSGTITNNTTGNVSLTTALYPAVATFGNINADSATGVGTATVWCAQLELGAIPSSPISSRNFFRQSQNFGTTWSQQNLGSLVKNIVDPRTGLTTAWTMTDNVTSGAHQVFQAITNSSGSMTVSVVAQAGTAGFLWLNMTGFGNTWFNLGTGVVGTNNNTTATIAALGNGLYRCTITNTAALNTTCSVGMSQANNVSTYAGTGSTIILYSSQIEVGSVATAEWAVNATVGGRDADNDSISLASLAGGGLSTTAGTLVTFLTPYGWTTSQPSSNARLYDDANADGVIKAVIPSAGGVVQFFRTDSVSNKSGFGAATPTPVNGALIQYAEVWDGAHLTGYVNGVAGAAVATVPPYTLTTALLVGANDGPSAQINGYLSFFYIPRALTAAEITALYLATQSP